MKEGKKRVLAEVWGWVWRLALAVVIAQAVHLVIFQPVEMCIRDRVGGGVFSVIAGPCSIESEEQVCLIAAAVKASGATMPVSYTHLCPRG